MPLGDDGICPRLLASWTAMSFRRRGRVLAVAGLVTLLAILAVVLRLGISTNTVDMLSPDLPFRQHAKALDSAFPELDDTIVAVVDAATPERADILVEALYERLDEAASVRAIYRPDGPFFRRHALLYLSEEELGQFVDNLASAEPLLATLSRAPNLHGLADIVELAGRAEAGDMPSHGLAALLAEMTASAKALRNGDARNLSWQSLLAARPERAADTRRFLIVQPRLDFSRLKPAAAAIDDLRAAARLVEAMPGGGGVRLTGEALIEHAELETVERSGLQAGLLSLGAVAVILVIGLGSVRLILASLTTLILGLVWTAGAAAVLVGNLNIISVAFAVLFVGLGIDFAIHFVLRMREANDRGEAGVTEAGRGTGCAILLSALCAAVGFLSFWPTDYLGLAELGLISAIGMFVAAVASLTVMPALVGYLGWRRRRVRVVGREGALTASIVRHRFGVLVVVAALCVIGSFRAAQIGFDFNPMNLRDPDSEAMLVFEELADDPRSTPYVVQVLAAGEEEAQRLAARFEGVPEVGGVRRIASFVPSAQERKVSLIADASFFLAPILAQQPSGEPLDTDARLAALERMREALNALALRQDAVGPQAVLLRTALFEMRSAAQAAELEERWTVYLPQLFGLLDQILAVEPFGREDLPEDLQTRWVAEDGRQRLEVRPQGVIRSNQELRSFAAAAQAITPKATGVPVVIDKASAVVLEAFVVATGIAAVGMLALLALALRRPVDVAFAIAPLPAAAVLTLATASLLGMSLNFANIIVLPLLMGLVVSSGIHLVLRWRQEGAAASVLASSTPRSVLLSVLTTLAAFGSLMLAEHPGMSSMGALLTIAVCYIVVTDLIALPALLAMRRPPAPNSPGERAA
ncbi:MAG: MMPL family transporter [Rhodovibrionaceae bacterium]|nr:MMPL family transporter [Rhodovibrionaceae bacterium]